MEPAPTHAGGDDRESAVGLRTTIDLAPIGIAHFGTDGRFLLANPCLCAILGYDADALRERTFEELTYREDLAECRALNERLKRGEIPSYRHEKRFVRADGRIVRTCVTVAAVRKADAVDYFVGVVEDISERRAAEEARRSAEQALREREEQLRALFEASPLGLLAMDLEGNPIAYNPKSVEMHGITLREAAGTGWTTVLHPDDRERIVASWRRAVRGVEPWAETYRFVHRDGRIVWVSGRAAPILIDGRVIGFVGALEDITSLKQAEAEREELLAREREARHQAEEATRLRDEMLAVVAHDLRNPLQSLTLGIASLLRGTATEEQRNRQLGIMQRTSRNMDRLIGNLLDVSRIEAGSFAVTRAPVDVHALFDEIHELFEAQARERDIALKCDIAPEVGAIPGDRDRLLQLLSNLYGNALKFTPPRGEVHTHASRRDDMLHVSISDTGPGVSPEQLPRVFDRFWTAQHTAQFGAGLGLPIAKAIVEAHGGHIRAESEPGRGMTVSFSLPCAGPGN